MLGLLLSPALYRYNLHEINLLALKRGENILVYQGDLFRFSMLLWNHNNKIISWSHKTLCILVKTKINARTPDSWRFWPGISLYVSQSGTIYLKKSILEHLSIPIGIKRHHCCTTKALLQIIRDLPSKHVQEQPIHNTTEKKLKPFKDFLQENFSNPLAFESFWCIKHQTK